MPIKKKTDLGEISISNSAIASVVANACLECYGVVGLASKTSISGVINEILKKENYSKGVVIGNDKSSIEIGVYLIIANGVKITEVLLEVQKKIKYVLEKTFSIKIRTINVYAQSLRNEEK